MIRILLILFLSVLSFQLQASPAYPHPMQVKQKDGSLLQVVLQGDESAHCFFTLDGVPVAKAQDDSYYYAVPAQDGASWVPSNVLAHEASERTPQEANFVKEQALPTVQVVRKVMAHRIQANNQRRLARRKGALGHSTSYVGDKKGLVILVNFADLKMHSSTARKDFDRMFNLPGCHDNDMMGSVSDYFRDQSYGQFRLTFDVVGPVTVSQPYGYYGKNSGSYSDVNVRDMVVEACNLVRGQVNFADYDWDNDGEVDQIYLIYAGYGEQWGASPSTIWPHESSLSDQALEIDGKRIDTYACSSELFGNTGKYYSGIGTACHEFSHCLGLPDIYDVNYSGGIGMANWDIMSGGGYAGHSGKGEAPCGYSAYERAFAGWLELKEINSSTIVTELPPIDEKPMAYVLYNEGNREEFFILENRQSQGWFTYVDRTDGCHGMLVTHVDYSTSAWERNALNTNPSHQRLSFVPAGGEYGDKVKVESTYRWNFKDDHYLSHLFPGKKKVTVFDNASHADCGGRLFNANSDGSYALNLPVTHIQEKNGMISFYVAGGRLLETPELLPVTEMGEGSFTANWKAVDEAEHYELELQDVEMASRPTRHMLLKETFNYFRHNSGDGGFDDLSENVNQYMGSEGWSAVRLYTSPTGVKLGTTSTGGWLQTPTFYPTADSVTVCLTAASVDTEGAEMRVSLEGEDAPQSVAPCSLSSEHSPLLLHFPCTSSALQHVKVEVDKRSYVDSLAIYDGRYEASDFLRDDADQAASSVVYTDVQATSLKLNHLGAKEYRYRVRALGGDFFSPWSSYQSVTLPSAESAIHGLTLATDDAALYYDISGKLLEQRPHTPGVYLMRRAGQVTKIVISNNAAR